MVKNIQINLKYIEKGKKVQNCVMNATNFNINRSGGKK